MSTRTINGLCVAVLALWAFLAALAAIVASAAPASWDALR